MGGNTGCGRARAGFARFPSRGPAGSDFSVLEKRVLLRSARPQFLRSESERGAGKTKRAHPSVWPLPQPGTEGNREGAATGLRPRDRNLCARPAQTQGCSLSTRQGQMFIHTSRLPGIWRESGFTN